MGADSTACAIKSELGIEFGETTPDGKFTLKEGECFGSCCDATVVIVNNKKMYCKITPENSVQFLDTLRKQGGKPLSDVD